MDNHPIPQDVTGFQFKLIGNMTVKQFAYLAVGGVLAVVSFHVPTNGSFFILVGKYLFMVLFALTAVALAFLPFEGRPLDTMIINFVKALFRPNQYIFQKTGGHLAFLHFTPTVALAQTATGGYAPKVAPAAQPRHDAKEQQLQALLQSIHSQTPGSQTPYDEKEAQFMRLVTGAQTAPQPTPKSPPPMPAPAIAVTPPPPPAPEPPPPPASEAPAVSDRLHTVLSNVTPPKTPTLPPLPAAPLPEPQPAMPPPTEATSEPVPAAAPQPVPALQQQPAMPQAPEQASPAAPITADAARELGLPHLPDSPNLILGIIKDSRGNVLSNVLVEVKDEAGNPVRAFKTNALGQFASATMLQNGTYIVDFEDPKGEHAFTSARLVADGTILQPLVITSTDAREELRRSLFG